MTDTTTPFDGQWLRDARQRVGLTQQQAAESIGLMNSTIIVACELGSCVPPKEYRHRYADVIGVEPRIFDARIRAQIGRRIAQARTARQRL